MTIISRENTGSYKWDKYKDRDILPFWIADMDSAVAPAIVDAVRKRLNHPIFGYASAPEGLAPAIAKSLQNSFDWEIDPAWLVWLPGVVPGLSASCRAFGKDGDEVITCPPIYHHFLTVAQPERKTLVTVPMLNKGGKWLLDFEGIERAITPQSSIFLLCSPHNPVGRVFSRQELSRLCDIAARNDMVIISDEVHCSLVLDRERKHIPTAKACPEHSDRIVTLMSPSKTFNLAGMNCSFAIIENPELRQKFLQAIKGVLPMVCATSYIAAEAAYREGWEWHEQLIEALRTNYDYLRTEIETIPGIKLTRLEATYLAWLDVNDLELDDPQQYFESMGLGFSDGLEFGKEGKGYLRWNFACPISMLEQGIQRLWQAVLNRPGLSGDS